MSIKAWSLLIIVMSLVPLQSAGSMAIGTSGNEPLKEADYAEWPGALNVINSPSRVYTFWVNGGELFYFQGNTESLNKALVDFSRIKMPAEVNPISESPQPLAITIPTHEVTFLPGPSAVEVMENSEISYDWKFEIGDGLSEISARKESATRVFEDYPVMTVYVGGGNIDLEDVRIPPGLSVVQLSDLRARYLEGLKSVDGVVRGIAAGRLAGIDPFTPETISPVTQLLRDPDRWVQSAARHALRFMGKSARPILATELARDDLTEAEETSIREALEFIDSTPADTEAESRFKSRVADIDAFLARYRAESQTTKNQE